MGIYNTDPVLADIKAKMFPYTDTMYPAEFANYYYNLPVMTPSGKFLSMTCTRYCSGMRAPRVEGRSAWRSAVKSHFDAKGWNPALKSWMATKRTAAVFYGHGLPEEISLVCTLALASGHKNEATLGAWANQMLGIDCNGFVNAYLTSIGLFTQPLHSHPAFINVSPPAKSISEISCDSVIVTAKVVASDSKGPTAWKVKVNPGDTGAHILVIDDWAEYGSSFWASDQPGTDYPGPQKLKYSIVKAPPANANAKLDRVFIIRKHGSGVEGNRYVYITRPMQSH